MSLDFINNLINAYKNISSQEGMEVFDERGHLSRVREIIEWHSLTNQELTFNGSPPKIKNKTLYDPSIVSERYLKEMVYKGFIDAIENNRFPGTFFEGHIGTIKVVGHYGIVDGYKQVKTWCLEAL